MSKTIRLTPRAFLNFSLDFISSSKNPILFSHPMAGSLPMVALVDQPLGREIKNAGISMAIIWSPLEYPWLQSSSMPFIGKKVFLERIPRIIKMVKLSMKIMDLLPGMWIQNPCYFQSVKSRKLR
jgi:hypothetical protein